jgi:NAD(P)-dependent dehydrogenase (short-subunit alcohol dehydrogenase family)
MSKRRVLITGANSGIGKAISIEMALKGYEVIMLCRNEKRGIEAFNEVVERSHSKQVTLEICDLSSFESILTSASKLKATYEHIDVIVNNAGLIVTKRQVTQEGFEMQLGVNHFGHFLLVRELLPLIKESTEGRIVVVSSGAHKIGKIHFDDLQLEKSYTAFKAYSQSKLANLLYAKALAKQLKEFNISVNALHPGAVGTNMGVDRETGFGKGLMKILSHFFITPEEGARTAVYLAISPEVNGLSGGYYYKQKLAPVSKAGENSELIQRFYELSEKLVKEKIEKLSKN